MNRFLVVPIVSLFAAGVAFAEFTGLEIREDKDMTNAPVGARTFNVYAKFDGQELIDRVLSTGNTGNPFQGGMGINAFMNPGADFYQENSPIIGGDNDAPPSPTLFDISPTFAFDTYVGMGLKVDASGTDATNFTPDFAFLDTDGSGGQDFIQGFWYNANPLNNHGNANANSDVFLAQWTIIGLSAGAEIGQYNHSTGIFTTNIFTGEMALYRQGDVSNGEEPAILFEIAFEVPTPGAASLFTLAFFTTARRRRTTA